MIFFFPSSKGGIVLSWFLLCLVKLIPVDEVCFCVQGLYICCQIMEKEECYSDAFGKTALLISAWFE